jgi:superfamily I DNA and/or RNA helicase
MFSALGREKKIIIVVSVRGADGQIGFLNDPRQINVMMKRAQETFIFIGDLASLGRRLLRWKSILDMAHMEGWTAYVSAQSLSKLTGNHTY